MKLIITYKKVNIPQKIFNNKKVLDLKKKNIYVLK